MTPDERARTEEHIRALVETLTDGEASLLYRHLYALGHRIGDGDTRVAKSAPPTYPMPPCLAPQPFYEIGVDLAIPETGVDLRPGSIIQAGPDWVEISVPRDQPDTPLSLQAVEEALDQIENLVKRQRQNLCRMAITTHLPQSKSARVVEAAIASLALTSEQQDLVQQASDVAAGQMWRWANRGATIPEPELPITAMQFACTCAGCVDAKA